MTCIVGIVDKGRVYIGGDSAGVGGYDLSIRKDQKVFENGGFLFGFTSSFRMGNLLQYKLTVPKVSNDSDLMEYMCTEFIDSIRSCLKDGGYCRIENGVENGGVFLVGGYGRLFAVHGDYQVAETVCGYDAVGCGAEIALGSLFSTKGEAARKRINKALNAASFHSAGVSPPFKVLSI